MIDAKNYEKLLEYDQVYSTRLLKNSIARIFFLLFEIYLFFNLKLISSMKKRECFLEFNEKKIDFPPTFKFDVNTHTYDTSAKQRIPSWCDRILYKIRNTEEKSLICEQLVYKNIDEYNQSDHKPVYSMFQIKVCKLWFYDWKMVTFMLILYKGNKYWTPTAGYIVF